MAVAMIRVAKRHRWTAIDRRTVNDERLSFRARGVLVWLLDKPDDWTSTTESIAEMGREGREAVRTALRELEEHGYLSRARSHNPVTGHWAVDWMVNEVPNTDAQEPVVGDGATDAQEPSCGFLGDIETTNKPKTDVCLPPLPPDEFIEFWSWYPNKVGKPAALRGFRAARRKADAETIYRGLHRWMRHWDAAGTAKQHIPYPATWLNQERWNDPCPGVTPIQMSPRERARAELERMVRESEQEVQHELG